MTDRRRFIKYLLSFGFSGYCGGRAAWAKGPTPRDAFVEADVAVIGSGPAGLSIADSLSDRGVNVVVVESGLMEVSRRHQQLGLVKAADAPLPYNVGEAGQRIAGGTSGIWGGVCPRLQASDLSSGSRYGYGVDWPIQHEDLSPYYCKAEQWLRVGTAGGNGCGEVTVSPYVESAAGLLEAMDKLDINAVPAAMETDRQGQISPLHLIDSLVPRLVGRKALRFLTDMTVRKIDVSTNGIAKGLFCSSVSGREHYLKAKLIVLAAGAVQNPRLLLLSANASHPDGLGNSSGHVGCWFMDHPNLQYWLKPKRKWLSPPYTAVYVHVFHWYEAFKKQELGSALMRAGSSRILPLEARGLAQADQTFLLEALCEQEPVYGNRVSLHSEEKDLLGDPLPQLDFRLTRRDWNTAEEARKRLDPLVNEFGEDYSLRPVRMGSHHLMGTTRMSAREKDGVVDRNLKVYGTKNLYVAGASVFPTGGAANPTLTLTALSFRLVNHILDLQSKGELVFL